jgi:hypothetical protein
VEKIEAALFTERPDLCVVTWEMLRRNLLQAVKLEKVVIYFLLDLLMTFTINKLFIASLAVLALASPGAYWRLDGRGRATQSVWPVRVLQATVVIQYFCAGWCKASHGDWLTNPYVLWSQAQGVYRTDLASWMLRRLPIGVWSWMQYAALTFELTAPLLFGVKRLRRIGCLWGAAFQLLIALTMYELVYFSLQMVCFFVLFLDERLLHRIRARLRGLIPERLRQHRMDAACS